MNKKLLFAIFVIACGTAAVLDTRQLDILRTYNDPRSASSSRPAAVGELVTWVDTTVTPNRARLMLKQGEGNTAWEDADTLTSQQLAPLPDISTPAAPSDGIKLYSTDIAGKSTLTTVDAVGIPTPMQPSLAYRHVLRWTGQPSVATFNTMGHGPGLTNSSGTITARSQGTNNPYEMLPRTGVVSAATASSHVDIRGLSTHPRVWRGPVAGSGGFHVVFQFMISDAVQVSTAHTFVGLISAPITTTTAPSGRVNFIGIGTDSGDTNLQFYAAGAAAQARTDLGVNFPANINEPYELTVYAPVHGDAIYWRVRRMFTGHETSGAVTDAAKLPGNATPIAPQLYRSNGDTAASVALDVISVYVESG